MSIDLDARAGLPEDLLNLLRVYPRDGWSVHPNFPGLVAFWLDRHGMFRKLTDVLRADAEAVMEGNLDPLQHKQRLARFGGMMVQQLHGHHQIEDMHYFPALVKLETRMARGFDILDSDHHALDGVLNRFTQSANAVLSGTGEPGKFRDEVMAFETLLMRHLDDEEDLIVPVLLKHGTDGLHG